MIDCIYNYFSFLVVMVCFVLMWFHQLCPCICIFLYNMDIFNLGLIKKLCFHRNGQLMIQATVLYVSISNMWTLWVKDGVRYWPGSIMLFPPLSDSVSSFFTVWKTEGVKSFLLFLLLSRLKPLVEPCVFKLKLLNCLHAFCLHARAINTHHSATLAAFISFPVLLKLCLFCS